MVVNTSAASPQQKDADEKDGRWGEESLERNTCGTVQCAQTVCTETGCTGTKLTHSITRQGISTHCLQDWGGRQQRNVEDKGVPIM